MDPDLSKLMECECKKDVLKSQTAGQVRMQDGRFIEEKTMLPQLRCTQDRFGEYEVTMTLSQEPYGLFMMLGALLVTVAYGIIWLKSVQCSM